MLEVGGFAWRFATSDDAGVLDRLAAEGANRVLFSLPATEQEFAARLRGQGYRLAMLCTSGARLFGAAAITARSNRDLNAMIACFFVDPSDATLSLALYVRHVFWAQPVHRLYTQLPLVQAVDEYRSLLASVGFQEEGVVARHAIIAGESRDVAVFGLLRPEFEAWCQDKDARLLL